MAKDDLSANTLFISTPVNALVEGIYEENIPLSEVKKHGDFGLGTFNTLDGEMMLLDGEIYRTAHDGRIYPMSDDVLTPFACASFFRPACHEDIAEEMSHESFMAFLEEILPSPNLFYVFRIDGEFRTMKTRSVPPQEMYRPLAEVAKDQQVFSFTGETGTLAGFFTPAFMSSINVPGFHFHFLSDDRKRGGHLLECRPLKARVAIQYIYNVNLTLPKSLAWLTLDFKRDTAGDLKKVE